MFAAGLAAVAFLLVRRDAGSRLELVALGDSYSAGVGLGEVSEDGCDRDPGAYGPRAAALLAELAVQLGDIHIDDVEHVACSGAVSENLFNPQTFRRRRGDDLIVAAQLDSVSADTDIVTMTIGGNDADFGGKVVTCLIGACGERLMNIDPSSFDDPLLTWELLGERLRERFEDVRRAMDPAGHLFVLSYPIPFEIEGARVPCAGFDLLEMLAGNALATRLGDTIAAATDAANAALERSDVPGNVTFVDWRVGERVDGGYAALSGEEFDYIDSPHGICSPEPFLNGFDPATLFTGDATNNFHPTAAGYGFAADVVAAAIGARAAG